MRLPPLLLLLLLPALARAASAPGGTLDVLTYQGRLRDAGQPVNGARTVEIFLCPQETGGVCTPTGAQGVSVVNGLFRTTFTAPVNLAAGPWYLEVQIGTDPPLTPRERLTASPYAVYASSAGALAARVGSEGVEVATSIFLTAGRLGIGTSAPLDPLDVVNGTVTIRRTDSQNAHLQIDGGPLAGNVWATLRTNTAAAFPAVFLRDHTDTTLGLLLAERGANQLLNGDAARDDVVLGAWKQGQKLHLATNPDGTRRSRVAVAHTGEVGVGVTAPSARLHVSSAGAAAAEAVFKVSSGTSAGQELLTVLGDGAVQLNGPVVILLRNDSGAALSQGELVEAAAGAGGDNAVTKVATANSRRVLGVVYDGSIANGAVGRIAVAGVAKVLAGASVGAGDRGNCAISNGFGQAVVSTSANTPECFGLWLEAPGNGVLGRVLLK